MIEKVVVAEENEKRNVLELFLGLDPEQHKNAVGLYATVYDADGNDEEYLLMRFTSAGVQFYTGLPEELLPVDVNDDFTLRILDNLS